MSATPGPWTALIETIDRNHRGGFSIEVDHGHTVICGRAGWPQRAEESAANARLIAAAPTLLEVLHRCAELLDDYSDVNDGENGQPVANRAMSLLRDVEAAIARAEGRS